MDGGALLLGRCLREPSPGEDLFRFSLSRKRLERALALHDCLSPSEKNILVNNLVIHAYQAWGVALIGGEREVLVEKTALLLENGVRGVDELLEALAWQSVRGSHAGECAKHHMREWEYVARRALRGDISPKAEQVLHATSQGLSEPVMGVFRWRIATVLYDSLNLAEGAYTRKFFHWLSMSDISPSQVRLITTRFTSMLTKRWDGWEKLRQEAEVVFFHDITAHAAKELIRAKGAWKHMLGEEFHHVRRSPAFDELFHSLYAYHSPSLSGHKQRSHNAKRALLHALGEDHQSVSAGSKRLPYNSCS